MNSYYKLVRVLMASLSMSKPQDKRRKVMMIILSLFAVFFVLLPVTFASGLIVKLMTETLLPFGCEGMGIELMFYVISIFTLIFGVNVIFNEFYFSNDLEYLLPLPLKPYQIAGAKFTAAFIAENMMQFTLVAASVAGFGIAANMSLWSWLLSIVGIITMPVVPMLYCAVLSMLVMYFTRVIKNKEIIQKISVFLIFLLVLVVVGSITMIQDLNIEHYVEAMATGNQDFFKVMRIVFPTVPLFVKSFAAQSVPALLAYIGVTVIYVVLFLLLSNIIYFDGLIGLSAANNSSKKHSALKRLNHVRQRSQTVALFFKEVKTLLRTPPFFTNCVAVNFLWPVFVYAMIKIWHYEITIQELRQLYAVNDFNLTLFIPLFIVGISLLVTAINSIGSNAISREGSQFQFMKYIPVKYSTQWHVKAAVSIFFSALGIWIFILPAMILIGMNVFSILVALVMSLLSIMLVTYAGIFIDSIQPKLIWDDEMSVLRENYNTFFSMAVAILETLVLCGGGFLLFCNTKISMAGFQTLLIVLLGMGNIVVLGITIKNGYRNISEQEET